MSYRYMRVLVLFDLPMVSAQERRIYSKFRKYLIKNGFLMLQESVYCKMALNQTAANSIMEGIRKTAQKRELSRCYVLQKSNTIKWNVSAVK